MSEASEHPVDRAPEPLPPVHFKRICFCTDFSENADLAFAFAVDLAGRYPGCQLMLLHVVPESDSQFWKTYIYEVDDVDNKARRDMDEQIAQRYLSRLPKGMELDVQFRIGHDWREIVDFAEKQHIDLIVMGRQGRSTLGTTFFGNVTERVVRKAPCAVLVIPRCLKM